MLNRELQAIVRSFFTLWCEHMTIDLLSEQRL